MASARGARVAAMTATGQIQDGEKRTLGEQQRGYDTATRYLNDAGTYYKPYADRYQTGSAAYSNALGLGGAQGNQSALDLFQNSPQAQLMRQNALQDSQGILRKASAGGMLGSGNTDADMASYMAGLYNKTYGDHLNQLNSYDQRGLQTAGAQSGILGNLAGLATSYYNNRANTIQDNINNIAGLSVGALKAGDQAKAQNQANLLAGGMAFAKILGGAFGL